MKYQDINSKTIDRWCDEGWEWGQPIIHETFENAKKGIWDVLLTPTKPVPHDWFLPFKGCKILGLASGEDNKYLYLRLWELKSQYLIIQ